MISFVKKSQKRESNRDYWIEIKSWIEGFVGQISDSWSWICPKPELKGPGLKTGPGFYLNGRKSSFTLTQTYLSAK